MDSSSYFFPPLPGSRATCNLGLLRKDSTVSIRFVYRWSRSTHPICVGESLFLVNTGMFVDWSSGFHDGNMVLNDWLLNPENPHVWCLHLYSLLWNPWLTPSSWWFDNGEILTSCSTLAGGISAVSSRGALGAGGHGCQARSHEIGDDLWLLQPHDSTSIYYLGEAKFEASQ